MDDKRTERASQSWSGLLFATVFVTLAALGTVTLLIMYLQARPVNLIERTRVAADAAEAALREGGIPRDNIRRGEEETHHDAEAVWKAWRFKVDLPSTVSAEGIEPLLTKALVASDASVAADGDTLRLLLAGREFAHIDIASPLAPTSAKVEPGPVTLLPPELRLSPVETPTPRAGLPSPFSPLPQPRLPGAALPTPATPQPAPKLLTAAATGAPLFAPDARPKVAIIVDDGGYGGEPTEAILAMDPHLTLSILPNTPHGTSTAERGAALGFEIMLHMPMQADDHHGSPLHPITLDMTPEQMAAITDADLAQLPGVVGINNHEGSKFTGDTQGVTSFMQNIKGRPLFFVDSLTTPLSVAAQVSRSMGIPTAARDVFLDNENNGTYIKAQFALLVTHARKKGRSIGICHFRHETARVLPDLLTSLRDKEGMDLVHVSELIQ